MSDVKLIQVVAAAILNHQGDVLIAKRPEHVHQGGLWEFPGGKIERDELPMQALSRELQEEVGILPTTVTPLIKVIHHYPDKSVHLDVYKVTDFDGEAQGMEGQAIRWSKIDNLLSDDFPAANKPIIDALQLPQAYMITGEWQTFAEFEQRMMDAIAGGVEMIQLRLKSQSLDGQAAALSMATELCKAHQVTLILNAENALAYIDQVDGVHLTSAQLQTISEASLAGLENKVVGASCHSRDEVEKAMNLGVTYVSLSPVLWTRSHPEQAPIGWEQFSELTDYSTVPVYALGGLTRDDIEKAIACGGQGIAGIGTFWGD